MNIKLSILLIVSSLFAQTGSFSLNGFGEKIESFDAASFSLGESKYFSANSTSFSFSSPSSYWKSDNTKLFMSININENDFGDKNEDLIENHFQMIAFMFPVGTNKACSFGMNPFYRSNATIVEDQLFMLPATGSPTGSPMASRTTYTLRGGISEFFSIFSMKINDNFSFGFRWSKMFGNSNYRYVRSTSDVSFDSNGAISYSENDISFGNFKQRYSSNSYRLELRYLKEKYEVVSSYMQTNSLKIKRQPEFSLIGIVDERDFIINEGLKEFGMGIKYKINNQLGIISEYHDFDSFDSFDLVNIFKNDSPNIISQHFGIYYNIKGNKNKLNQINLRMGLYSKIYEFESKNIDDWGLTFGAGFEYNEFKNSMDFSFKYGKKQTEYAHLKYEKYFNFIFSISSGEKWFVREKEE